MNADERRRRLAVRHGLAGLRDAAPGGDSRRGPASVGRQLVALHATDPATVFLSIWARMAGAVTPADVEECIYERRELVRMLAMRRTVFVVPTELVPAVQASTTDKIAADQRALLIKLLAETGIGSDAWLADLEQSVLRVLAEMGGSATAAELTAAEPRLRSTITLAVGKPYQATQNITSRVLLVLSAQGRIVRGRPVGSWLSQQYRWALTEHWLPAASPQPLTESAAKTELARHWLAAFGPAPLSDLKWWTGWTMAQVKHAVAALGAVEVDLGGAVGLALPDDLNVTPDPGEWVALLPALDPTVMGWSDRSWFLGPHGPALFDTNGNAGPTVWLNGRVVGGWAQRGDGDVVVRILDDVGTSSMALIESRAASLGEWLKSAGPGGVRVIPRFRTPTERELST